MTAWNEWFANLDGRLDPEGQLPEIHEFIRGVEQCRSDRGLVSGRSRSPALDDLRSTALFAGYLAESAAESHHLAASLLYSQGKEASWLPAALPNSEESRLVKRLREAVPARLSQS
ncbi:MAG TPA: hypothetical protein VEW48_03180 [Thermoanaerobaculia bacterium]|nr:hypothetical protein [Thermoanaerobaculia bacterium]